MPGRDVLAAGAPHRDRGETFGGVVTGRSRMDKKKLARAISRKR